MERRDFRTAWDQRHGKAINAAELAPSERYGLDVKHRIVLIATNEDVSLLLRGLRALRATAELQSAVDNSTPRTEEVGQLEKELATPRRAEPIQTRDLPEGYFVTPIV